MRKTIFAILVSFLFLLSACVSSDKTINVEGDAELTFDPDQAEVLAGISILDESAEQAQTQANTIINNMITGFEASGISGYELEIEQLSLYEEFSYDEGVRRSAGWRATQILKIKIADLTKVGTIVDIAVTNGANQINNIEFSLTDEKQKEYEQQALAQATKNAKAKAETIAESLGVKLSKIKSVSESVYYYRPYAYTMEKTAGAEAVAEAAQLPPGQVSVTGHVNLVYSVR